MNGEKELLLKLLAYGIQTGEFHLEEPGEAASAVLFMVEGVKMCSEVMPITEEMLTGIYHQIKKLLGVSEQGAGMITRKQKRSILYILFVFILCSAAKDFEFLVLKTDETFLAENIFCKIFAILVISQCLVERKLSWRSIGFRLKGIKKGLFSDFP